MSSYNLVKDVKIENEVSLLERKNVVGVGVGLKIVRGRITDELSVKVYVEKKRVLSRLADEEVIPREFRGVKTDVVEIGRIRFQGRRDRNRPTRGGDSIGSCHSLAYGYISAGTLGIPLIDKTDGRTVLLSNNHVIANLDTETETRASAGDNIVQPGTLDGGSCTTDLIGTLKRWIPFKITGDNYIDAAIADLNDENDALDCEVGCDIGKVTSYKSLSIGDLNMQVQKCGRTTGYTTGTVIDVDATINVNYEVLTSTGIIVRTLTFKNQILTTGMSDSGDSGSLVLDMNKNAVGLLFAGSSTTTVANRIEVVLDVLDLELCPAPDIHCPWGRPDREIVLCRRGGPQHDIHCVVGRPDSEILCHSGGPMILCRPGTPGMVIHCIAGGPDSTCRAGGPGITGPLCLACGPDSPIGCSAAGPDHIIDGRVCKAGPSFDIGLKPGVNPGRLVILDLDKVPPNMRASLERMLERMAEEG